MLFIFIGFIGNSSYHYQWRILQEFGQHENFRFGVARHRIKALNGVASTG